jgi:hypothetical protein
MGHKLGGPRLLAKDGKVRGELLLMITSSQLERGPVTRPNWEGRAGYLSYRLRGPFVAIRDHSAGPLVWIIIVVRKGHLGTTRRTITFSPESEGDGLLREYSRNEADWGN